MFCLVFNVVRVCILGALLLLAGCERLSPAVIQPPEATPEVKLPDPPAPDGEDDDLTPEAPKPVELDAVIDLPVLPMLNQAGLELIYEFEVGGRRQYERSPHPELPDLRYSGVTWGIGYDGHQYSKSVILSDWSILNPPSPQRLSETQPYYGRSAVEPWKKVRDILIPWSAAESVFINNDISREFASAKRAFPGFENLSKNCQAALMANGFARGYSFTGDSRKELREIRDLVPKLDYSGIAEQLRKQERVWRGTTIYNGLKRRVYAEADLAETPDAL